MKQSKWLTTRLLFIHGWRIGTFMRVNHIKYIESEPIKSGNVPYLHILGKYLAFALDFIIGLQL